MIGDPQQLNHISNVTSDEEQNIKKELNLHELGFLNYVSNSLWDYCSLLISNAQDGMNFPFRLNNHYRCHPDIIGYSNDVFYSNNCERLNILTHIDQDIMNQGIIWDNVQGEQIRDNLRVNVNEADKAVSIAEESLINYPNKSIGIITPFRKQEEYIYDLVKQRNLVDKITVSTVHKYLFRRLDIYELC